MYVLTDVVNKEQMDTKREALHIIGKEFDVRGAEVGRQAILDNLTDAHMYRRITRTPIIDSIKESLKELHIIAQDAVYILKKI